MPRLKEQQKEYLSLVEEKLASSNFRREEYYGEMKRNITTPYNLIYMFINKYKHMIMNT